MRGPSNNFTAQAINNFSTLLPLLRTRPGFGLGEAAPGKGVRVAVVDSGVEFDHPAVGDSVRGGIVVEDHQQAESLIRYEAEEDHLLAGHGTACAGIIHALVLEARD